MNHIFSNIFHVMINSFIVFFIIAFFVELFLILFKIKNERVRFFCKLLPIVKLPLDFILHKLFHISYLVNFNPFSCERYLYDFIVKLLASPIQIKLINSHSVTFSDFIIKQVPPIGLYLMMIAFCALSIFMMGRKGIEILHARIFIKKVFNNAIQCSRQLTNQKLIKSLHHARATIMLSSLIDIPMATQGRLIIFPLYLIDKLSQEEYEAIVAHELEHLRWYDPYVKLGCHIICALFWWIPTRFWLKKLEIAQENASDSAVLNYGIDHQILASAVVKVIRKVKHREYEISNLCQIATPKSIHIQRLENILNFRRIVSCDRLHRINCILGVLMCAFSFISFWIC